MKYNDEIIENITIELDKLYDKAYEDGYKQANKDKGIDLYQRENINFSVPLSEDDERNELYKEQRLERGFDDSELWNLDSTIAKFIFPRLKAFKENHAGHPSSLTSNEWNDILDSMIKYFEGYCSEDFIADMDKKGLDNFCKYFCNLWD